MEYTKPINLGIAEKLKTDESYRKAFFRSYATDSIALQIRELRKLRENMTQVELAESCGMKQSAVSRIEQAEYSSWSFNTLSRVADALKSRLIIKFQPIEEAIRDYEVREEVAFPKTDSSGNIYTAVLSAREIRFTFSTRVNSGVNAEDISFESTPTTPSKNTSIRTKSVRVVNQNTEISHG